MAMDINLPQFNMGMNVGIVAKWLVEVGQSVSEGEIICEIESEKATNELTAPASGTIIEILIAKGDSAEVGEVLARIE